MKGHTSLGVVQKAGPRGFAKPSRVPTGGNVAGLTTKVGSTKTMTAGGFTASRRKGSVKGSHSVS